MLEACPTQRRYAPPWLRRVWWRHNGDEAYAPFPAHRRFQAPGNPRCYCASDPAARHGPYYEWSYLKGGKLRHRTLTPEQAEIMRLAIANHRRAKKLLRAWEAQTLHLIELQAPK